MFKNKYLLSFVLLLFLCSSAWGAKPVKSIIKPVASGTVTQANMKISAVNGTAFIDFTATPDTKSLVATGTTTLINSRISAVDGTAFIDNSSAGTLTAHIGKYIEWIDPSGKKLTGWIKAAGTGETLGSELITNGTFDSDTGWTKESGWTISGGLGVATAVPFTNLFQNAIAGGVLYKATVDYTISSGGFRLLFGDGTESSYGVMRYATGSLTEYRVSNNVYAGVYGANATGTVDNLSMKQVTAPSTTGVTIVSTREGATYNWTSKESGFDYNASAGYTYKIYDINPLPVKNGNLLVVRDSAGKAIQGWIKAAGTSETLGSELITGWSNSGGGWDYETLTVNANGHDIDSAIETGSAAQADAVKTITIDSLVKMVTDITINSGGSPKYSISPLYGTLNNSTVVDATNYISWSVSSGIGVYIQEATNFSLLASVKQVLTPSATGVTIVSIKGGSTYNFAAKDSSFNYNDSSGYTYQIYRVNSLVEVSGFGGAVTASQEHASTVAGTAFYFSDSLDFSAYQDGKHYLRLKDAAGVVAWGKIKAETSAGEALGAETLTGWTNRAAVPFETLTTAGKDITQAVDTAGNSQAYSNEVFTAVGTLYKISQNITINSGITPQMFSCNEAVTVFLNHINFTALSAGVNNKYITGLGTLDTRLFLWINGGNSDFSAVESIKPVTAPPATGAIIINAAGTQNFISVGSGFNPNNIAEVKVYFYGE